MNHISRHFRGTSKKWILSLLISTVLLVGCDSSTPTIAPVISTPAPTATPNILPTKSAATATVVAVPVQTDGIWMYIKNGQADTLIADGKSQTIVMVDLSDCVWYEPSGPGGMIQVEFLNTLGITASPPSIFSTKGELGSPFELQIKAGTQTGTARISATASYCSEGNVMVFGVCSSQEEQDNPKCTGEFLISIQPAADSSEGSPPEEKEESEDLAVSISCTPNPKTGRNVTCSASVSGEKDGESLEYIWILDGAAGSKTKANTYTWKPTETGYYEISVEVFGGDRRAKNDLRVEVSAGDSSAEEDERDDPSGSDVASLRASLESFLKSAGVSKIHPARLAAAGGGAAALIAIWMIIQHRSGVPMEKLESAIGQWRWREGVKVPESPPEAEVKAPEKKPDQLPETKKTDPPKKEPPKTLPEEKKGADKARVSASAEFSPPATDDALAEAAVTKPPVKPAKGETGEERAERLVDDLEDYRSAVDKTLSDFKKKLEDVPKEVKESKFWKEKVAPKLKKLDDMGIESKSGKLKEFLRITKELLQVRKRVDAEMAVFSKEDREGVVWLVRGLQAGQEGLSKLHNQLITDPAIKAAKAGLPKKQAEAVEKFLKKHQSEIEGMLKGIRDLPINMGKTMGKAMHLDQNVGIIKKDTVGVTHKKWDKTYKFDLMKSPREKLGPVIKYVEDTGSAIMKKLGKTFIFLRDTRPKQE